MTRAKSKIPISPWLEEYRRKEAAEFAEHSARRGMDWGLKGDWAFMREAEVRKALAAADPRVAEQLKLHPQAVRSSMSPSAIRTDWTAPDWRAVMVFTEHGIGDPYEYAHVHEAFDKAVELLDRQDPEFAWSWESINPAVHVFRAEARLTGNPPRVKVDMIARVRSTLLRDGQSAKHVDQFLRQAESAGSFDWNNDNSYLNDEDAEQDFLNELHGDRLGGLQGNPPRVFRAQKVVAQLQKETRPAFHKGSIISSPRNLVEDTLDEYLAERATEVFLVLYLSVKNQVVGYIEYASGGTSGVEVHASGVMRDALLSGAAGIITVHNHPSGDATPSFEDRQLWKRLRDAGALIGIPVVDNLVVGEGEFFSEGEGSTVRFHRKERSS